MVADDLTKGEHVYGEEKGTKDRTLWHAMVNSGLELTIDNLFVNCSVT